MGAHGSDGGKTQQVVTPLWTTPQLDKFIKDVEALKGGLKTNLIRIRDIDLEVQIKRESLIKRSEQSSKGAAAAAAAAGRNEDDDDVDDAEADEADEADEKRRASTSSAFASAASSSGGRNTGGTRGERSGGVQKIEEVTVAAAAAAAGAESELAKERESLSCAFDVLIARSEDKIHIAGQTYDLVDLHTCSLDKALKSLEEELRSQRRMASLYDPKYGVGGNGAMTTTMAAAASGHHQVTGKGQGRGGRGGSRHGSAKRSLDGKMKAITDLVTDPANQFLIPEMKVDPCEPTYCYCKKVSFGHMVGCDNDDCPWEWFHIACVGILPHNMPRGKWFCPECKKSMKK